MRSLSLSRSPLPALFCALVVPLLMAGCDTSPTSPSGDDPGFETNSCTIPTSELRRGCSGADCIPSIDGVTPGDERLVEASSAGELADTARVIGIRLGEQAVAVPHSILWSHEVVNFDGWGDRSVAVTYCPLTGSSLAFDRSAVDGAELGVSGLLFRNNLVMYDRREEKSLWPQMNRQANCGAVVGTTLDMVPAIEMRWPQWQRLHPDTKVLTDGGDFQRAYPYEDYEALDSPPFDGSSFDTRRPPKERVLGIPAGADGGIALPFRALDARSPMRVVRVTVGGTQRTVFWSREAESAMAFETSASFTVQDGAIVDEETGSTWSVNGEAVDGPRAGDRLEPVDKAYVAFWFAWAEFQPDTVLWTRRPT